MSKALAPVPPPDPYDHTDARNRLAVHRTDERALALRTEIGRIVLGDDGGSEFAALARAAGIPPEALVLELASVARKRPEILRCTRDSILTFMLDVATLGLRIGREVYPVPIEYQNGRELRLEAWPSYQGNRALAIATGAVRDIWAQVVFAGDTFEHELAPIPRVKVHQPGPHYGDMSHAVGVYATILYPGAGQQIKQPFYPKAKIEQLRKRNRGNTTKSTSPWVSHPEEMWKAKAVKMAAKDLPQNPRLAHLFRLDARQELALPADAPRATDLEEVPDLPVLPGPEATPEPPPEAEPTPEPMALGVAGSLTITVNGGHVRRLDELRSSHLEAVRTWARRKLDENPDAVRMQQVAEACGVLLEARADGRAKEPPKREAVA